MSVALTWLSTTADGKQFARDFTTIGDLFGDAGESQIAAESAVAWDAVAPETPVTVTDKEKRLSGHFLGRRASWIDVRIDGHRKSFRANQVQVAGA